MDEIPAGLDYEDAVTALKVIQMMEATARGESKAFWRRVELRLQMVITPLKEEFERGS